MKIAILGRQPKLGLAELESLYGPDQIQPLENQAALINTEAVETARLGSCLKIARPIAEIPTTNWNKLTQYCAQEIPKLINPIPEGKIKFGLSVYGLPVSTQQLFRSGLELKKIFKAQKRSVRIIPATSLALNSAQVLHNQMTGPLGLELLFIKNGSKTWLAQNTWVQDVDDYSRRDFGRPKRDAKVGMLPPKLAQIMINLAGTTTSQRILDPFCGTGVVLQEAALLGCSVYGTDIEQRMIEFSHTNLDWLADIYKIKVNSKLEVADATKTIWETPIDHVVCETYLGQALSGLPSPEKLNLIKTDCNTIISKFLVNLHRQLKTGTRICVAVPAWQTSSRMLHLPLLDRLEEMGYNRLRFKHASWDDLVYHREDQIVARELLVLEVK
jgi:tRNA (guanine10-N2)-dimethyltransferase